MSLTKILQFFFIGLLEVVFCEREHRVHNIVLYPEKHSWCQTHQIEQIVSSPGYEPVTIANNVCMGACYSYSIPKTEPAEPGEVIGPYCDSCQPSEIKCYHVKLHADDKNIEGPKIIQKRVQIIMNCACQSCDKIRKEDCEITDENTLELPQNLFQNERNAISDSSPEDFPDILEKAVQNDTENDVHPVETDVKIKNRLKKLFEIYQNSTGDVKNDDDSFLTLQKYLNNYNKDIDNNIKIEKDLEGLPSDFGLEGVPSHHRGNHIGMGIQHSPNDIEQGLSKSHHEPKSGHHGHHSSYHHHGEGHHLHHLGEEQQIGMNVVHLIKGPHGSLVLSPVEAKLHIDSDALKPNSEGVVIDYENHFKTHHKGEDD